MEKKNKKFQWGVLSLALLMLVLLNSCINSNNGDGTVKVRIDLPNKDIVTESAATTKAYVISAKGDTTLFYQGPNLTGPWETKFPTENVILLVELYDENGTLLISSSYPYRYAANTFKIQSKLEITPRQLNLLLSSEPVLLGVASFPSSWSPAMQWSTSNPLVASVSSQGVVTPVSGGNCWVKVESENVMDSIEVIVVDNSPNVTPLEILNQPVGLEVLAGEPASFSVEASGDSPVYQWQLNGADIPGANSPLFTIPATTLEMNGGAYQCVINSQAQTITSNSAVLLVVESVNPVVIVTQPVDVNVSEGEPANFFVIATGTNPTYQWYKNGGSIIGAQSNVYNIPSALLSDNGAVIMVEVSNSLGSEQSVPVTLSVISNGTTDLPPEIITHPQDVSVILNSPAQFTVLASDPNASIQWQRDGVDITGENSNTLSIAAATMLDNGAAFRAIATNSVGSVTSTEAILTVSEQIIAPEITADPVDVTVKEGESASFTVTTAGTNPSIKWQRDGVDIPGANSKTITIDVTTQSDDGATFSAVATNSAGSATSAAATLTVSENIIAPTITENPANISVTEGESASFTVAVSGTSPSVQWKRDGVDIPGETSLTLIINPTSLSDDGAKFSATASNSEGSVSSTEATLNVAEEIIIPAITTQPSNVSVTEGEPATFNVAYTGTNPTIQWQRDGVNIPGATNDSYTINSTQLSDDGAIFKVVITNSAGSATSLEVTLTVDENIIPPSISTHPVDVTVNEGENASFSVVATGTNLQFQWQKDGANITGATSSQLSLSGVSSTNAGSYRVVVSNSEGSENSNAASLTVIIPPTITNDISSSTVNEGQAITLAITASGSTPLQYQWYKNAGAISGATSASYRTPSFTPADNGAEYYCRVSNAAGEAFSSIAAITVIAKPSIITQPASQTATVGDQVRFTVVATGDGTLSYQWQKNNSNMAGQTGTSLTLSSVSLNDDASTYRVVITNAAGSVTSSTAILTVQDMLPSPASNLVATSPDYGTIALTWADNSTNESGFRVQRSTQSNSGFQTIATVGANVKAYTNTGVGDGNRYYYQILAYNSTGNASPSNVANATTWGCGDDLVDPRDQTFYPTVLINGECWTQRNMNWIANVGISSCYDDYCKLAETYGRLYDWTAAKAACPSGWSLASYNDYLYLIQSQGGMSSISTAPKLIEAGATIGGVVGTNESGFSARRGGYYTGSAYANGPSNGDADNAYFFCAGNSGNICNMELRTIYPYLNPNVSTSSERRAVRCTKD